MSELTARYSRVPLGGLDLPVSVEAPSLAARRDQSPAQFARRIRRAVESVLG